MWWIWHDSVSASGLTCSDHRHPGSKVARPTASSPSSTSSTRPFSTVRTSSGLSNRLRRSCMDRSYVDNAQMASYEVNPMAVARAEKLIDGRQYVLDSDWGEVQPRADDENAYLESHGWDEYAEWHLGLTDGAADETKARYAFVYGDFRRIHRTGLIACEYRAAEWRHKDVELAAHELLQRLDRVSGLTGSKE